MLPRLSGDKKIVWDQMRGVHVLLQPETVTFLSETAACILRLCDGTRTLDAIVRQLQAEYEEVNDNDVDLYIRRAEDLRWIETSRTSEPIVPGESNSSSAVTCDSMSEHKYKGASADGQEISAPLSLTAELSHACPLACAYCSNPLELVARGDELTTQQWCDVFRQARKLGVWQVHLTGGEPLVRKDLEELVSCASNLELYSNLITSGVGLNSRIEALRRAGLNSVQISIQDTDSDIAAAIVGGDFLPSKVEAMRAVKSTDLPLVVNIVLHRHNIGRLEKIVELAASFRPCRIELANVQLHGWAKANELSLLPTLDQLQRAETELTNLRAASPHLDILWVRSDYYESYPKPCMGGWGERHIVITPDGVALPCVSARMITSISFEKVQASALSEIWYQSDSFKRFRGFDWMESPCRECPRKEIDFGGCRCQAFALTQSASATDPVCHLSAQRWLVDERLSNINRVPIVQKEDGLPHRLRGK